MKPTKIAVVATLAVVIASLAWFSMSQTPNPLSVAFIGFTIVPRQEPDLHYENIPCALFQVTNHSAVDVWYKLSGEAFQSGASQAEPTWLNGGYISNHAVATTPFFTPGGTNAWRFHAVLSAWGTRPRWQQNVRAALDKVGVRPSFLSLEKSYRPITNEWIIP